jgi:hypothetical protein
VTLSPPLPLTHSLSLTHTHTHMLTRPHHMHPHLLASQLYVSLGVGVLVCMLQRVGCHEVNARIHQLHTEGGMGGVRIRMVTSTANYDMVQ